LVYTIDAATVEYVCDDRKQESLESYYQQFAANELKKVKAIAMDMWEPFIKATKAYVPGADEKIVFDRFHVMRHVIDAVDYCWITYSVFANFFKEPASTRVVHHLHTAQSVLH